MKKVVVIVAFMVFPCMYGSFPNWAFTVRIIEQEGVTKGFLRELATSEAKYREYEQGHCAEPDRIAESKHREACFVKDFTTAILPGLFQGENSLKLIVVEQSDANKERKYIGVGYAIFQDSPRYIVQVRYLSVMLNGIFSHLVGALKQQYPSSLITVTAPENDLFDLHKEVPLEKLSLTETARLQLPLFRPCGAHYTNGVGWEYHPLPPENERSVLYRFVAPDDLLEKQKAIGQKHKDAVSVLIERRDAQLKKLVTAACAALRTLPLADGSSSGDTSPLASASSSRASSPALSDFDFDDSQDSETDDRESDGTHDRFGIHSDGTMSFGIPGDRGYRRLQGKVRNPWYQPEAGWFDSCVIS